MWGRQWTGLAFVGGQDGSDKSADLPRRTRDGRETRELKKIRFSLSPLSPPLPFSLSSLLGRTHCGLRVLTGLSHCERPRQVFDQIIDVFDADREAHEIGRRRESVSQRLWDAGV